MKKVLFVLILFICMFSIQLKCESSSIFELKKDAEKITHKTIDKFKDVSLDAWYIKNVSLLTQVGIINGYEDSTFKPNNKITRAQFIKMVITALGLKPEPTEDYWARGYIEFAKNFGAVNDEVISNKTFDVEISRGEMAKIIMCVLGEKTIDNLNNYEKGITDIASVKEDYKYGVLGAYSKGILTGYPDGEFKPLNSLTRAEAATVIVRMLDKEERAYIDTILDEKIIARLKSYPKRSDTGYKSETTGNAIDFEKFGKEWPNFINSANKLARRILILNKDKLKLKDSDFYTNKGLAYSTDKGIMRIRGIIDNKDYELEFGMVEGYDEIMLLTIKTLK